MMQTVTTTPDYLPPSGGKMRKVGSLKDMASGLKTKFRKIRRRLSDVSNDSDVPIKTITITEPPPKEIMRHVLENGPVMDYAGYSKKGFAPHNTRKPNQDGIIMVQDDETNTLVLCVLDGHGPEGHGVSAEFTSHLADEMFKHDDWASDMQKACKQAILKLEQDVIQNENIETDFSGTTLSMALIRDNVVTSVNVGDSRVILAQQLRDNGSLTPFEITSDHKPEDPTERARILAAGGRVFPVTYDDGVVGPDRVWLKHVDAPGLAMSRSLGDVVGHRAGMISDPEFRQHTLDPSSDKFLVVATDGLWEFVGNQETIDIANSQISTTHAVHALTKESNSQWMKQEQVVDDTTIIVANLFEYKQQGKQ